VNLALALLLLLATPLSPGAASLSEQAAAKLIEQAETAFAEGVRLRDNAGKARPLFHQAAGLMEQLLQSGINNPLLHRNLGNAYLLADDLPRAIRTYRQGLRIVPEDRDLISSLNEARELVVYPAGSSLGRPGAAQLDYRPPWFPRIQPFWFMAGAVLLYLGGWVAMTRWIMVRRSFFLALGLGAYLAAGGLALVLFNAARREKAEMDTPLVVLADDGVLLRKGNNLNFPPRWKTPVNKGVEARLLFERGDFVQIQLAGGEIGWVPRKFVLVDEP
jgi:tetratricopeptide (TPR) repeat protein